MRFRKVVLVGLVVLAVGAGWLARSVAEEKPASTVTYFGRDKVDAAFAKGGELFAGVSWAGNYKVITARRDRPGEVEIHNLDTDIIYVVAGTATFATGGTAVATKNTAPDEIRGQSIQGGEARQLSKGDVIVVPHGVPHWFKEVQAPFLYFVVKVH